MATNRRDSAKEAFWRDVLTEQATSDLSGWAFWQQEELKEPAFYTWRRMIAEREGQIASPTPVTSKQSPKRAPALVPAVVKDEPRLGASLTIELASDRVFGNRIRRDRV